MYKTFSNLDWKILVAICFITFGLISVFLFISSNLGSSNTKLPQSISLSNQQNATLTPILTPGLQVYKETDYSISYPTNATVTTGSIYGGGSILIFHLPQGPKYNMNLEILSDSLNSVETISKIFRAYKYQEENIDVDGKSAKKFSGTLVLEDRTLQETAVIVGNLNQVYKFQLTYSGAERNSEVDDEFSHILSTFHFVQ